MTAALDPFDYLADRFDPPVDPHLHDMSAWARAKLGAHFWSVQQRIAQALDEHDRVAVPSCHGAGKSFFAAAALAHHIDTHPKGTARAVSSAPSDNQVKAVLWDEVKGMHERAGLAGHVGLDAQWKIDGRRVAFGRKPADLAASDENTTVTAFQGYHAEFMAVLFDEATGIPKPLWTAAGSLLTNDDGWFLAIGNPDDPTSEFHAICAGADPIEGGMSDRGWYVIPISVFDTPNFTGEDVPDQLRRVMPSWAWLERSARDWGGDALVEEARRIADGGVVDEDSLAWSNALFMSKALGRFPTDSSMGVIPWSWLQHCRGDDAIHRVGARRVPHELGVDVGASDNGDLTIIRERQGMHAGRRWWVQSADPEKVTATIVDAIRDSGADRVKVDVIGVGWGLVPLIRRDVPDVDIVGVDVREAAPPAPDGTKFLNTRSALWWEVGRALARDRAWDLTAVDDRTLADLAAPRWHEDKAGRIVIEEKETVRKRLGRSPDDADALLLAFYVPRSKAVTEVKATDERLSSSGRAR